MFTYIMELSLIVKKLLMWRARIYLKRGMVLGQLRSNIIKPNFDKICYGNP